MGKFLGKQLKAAAKVERKPDTKSRKMTNVIRYVTGSSPTKKASANVSKPC